MLVLKLCQAYCPEKTPALSNKIADGADGELFELIDNPNAVIKLSVLYEYPYSNIDNDIILIDNVINFIMKYSPDTYARVFAYEKIGRWSRECLSINGKQDFIIYYYIMEKLQKISEDEKKVFHSILSHEDRGIRKDFSLSKINKILDGLSLGLDFNRDALIFFISNFRKTPIEHMDLHPRNIMKSTNGQFKLVDFDRCILKIGE